MDSPQIDPAALARLMRVIGGDTADLRDLLGDFTESAPEIVANMRAAMAEDDMATLRRGAHTLKSNARDFGATVLANLCDGVERAACAGASVDPGAVTAIADAVEAALAALAALDLDTVGAPASNG